MLIKMQEEEKEDQFTGRAELAKEEIETFLKNPFFGVGVGKTAEIRQQRIGEFVASHDEITRMASEHGALGVLGLLILFATPLFLYLDNNHNIYLLSFYSFLDINYQSCSHANCSTCICICIITFKSSSNQ